MYKEEQKQRWRIIAAFLMLLYFFRRYGAFTVSGNRKHFQVLIQLNSAVVGQDTEITFTNLFTLHIYSLSADLSVDWSIVFCRESHKVLPSKKKEMKHNSRLC